ncbi:MAG: HNH/ENDO VII family nuclease [Rhodothermales bacterium]
MPLLEIALQGLVAGAAGQLGREVAVRGVAVAEQKLAELQKSADGLRVGELGRQVPAETVAAQAEMILLERDAINRQLIREVSPYSEEMTQRIRNPSEVKVYTDAGLQEATVNDRPCLVRSDIDPEIQDDFGRTNAQRMERGLAPLDNTGKSVELHHVGQTHDAPLAELSYDQHKVNYSVLHERCESQIDRSAFGVERKNHWKTRATHVAP